MRNLFVCFLVGLVGLMILSGCATRIEREGVRVTTWDKKVARTAIQPIVVETEENNKSEKRVYYSVGLEICRELASQNPNKDFIYEGPNKCRVVDPQGQNQTLRRGVWENWQGEVNMVEIRLSPTARVPDKRFVLGPYKHAYLSLQTETEYYYKIIRFSDQKVVDQGVVTINSNEGDAYSTMREEWLDFVFGIR